MSERKRDLGRLCRKARVPCMRRVETFPDGAILFEHCAQFGFEGIVSKRVNGKYVSGPCRTWLKLKCPEWRRDNE